MTTNDEFAAFRRDDLILTAAWCAGIAGASSDRLKAYEEIRRLQARAARSSGPHLHFEAPAWAGAQVIVDSERDYWDLQPDGRYKMRANNSATMTARHIEACYSPIKVIDTSSMNGAAS